MSSALHVLCTRFLAWTWENTCLIQDCAKSTWLSDLWSGQACQNRQPHSSNRLKWPWHEYFAKCLLWQSTSYICPTLYVRNVASLPPTTPMTTKSLLSLKTFKQEAVSLAIDICYSAKTCLRRLDRPVMVSELTWDDARSFHLPSSLSSCTGELFSCWPIPDSSEKDKSDGIIWKRSL